VTDEPRFHVEHDDASRDEEGYPIEYNTGHPRTSWYVVDSAPGKPYGIAVAEFIDDSPLAERWALSYARAREAGAL